MAKIIAVANQKGGVGKTTTAINLSASLAVLEYKTLLIDSDPQGNSTSGVGIHSNNIKKTIYDSLVNGNVNPIQDAILQTNVNNLFILPSDINLVASEIEMVNEANREYRLRELLEPLRSVYDFIIIDCSPSLGLITVNSLVAADSVLIPVQCEYFALEGLGKLLNTIKIIQSGLNDQLQIEGLLMTMYDSRLRLCNQVISEVKQHFGEMVCNTIIHRNIKISEAPSVGKPIVLYDTNSKGTTNYIHLAKEILEKNNLMTEAHKKIFNA